ncbi:MAG: hypothetical protein JSR17_10430 [Proteobacteria bacterium]|nr:hypothetical protein [Pseudomonadota bacterium]
MSTTWLQLLANNELIRSIKIKGQKVKIKLYDKYSDEENYRDIMGIFSNLHTKFSSFKNVFKRPIWRKDSIGLTLKDPEAFENGEQLLTFLVELANQQLTSQTHNKVKDKKERDAKPSRRRTYWRTLLGKGELFESLEVKNKEVTILLKKEYDDTKNRDPIFQMLRLLFQGSQQMSLFFCTPKFKQSEPLRLCLTDAGLQKTPIELLEILKDCVKEKKQIKRKPFKKLLAKGALIQSATLEDDCVTLSLVDEFKNDVAEFRKSLNGLYRKNADFRKAFLPITLHKSDKLDFYLQEDHGFKTSDEVCSALTLYAKSKRKKQENKITLAEPKSVQSEDEIEPESSFEAPTIPLPPNTAGANLKTIPQLPSFLDLKDLYPDNLDPLFYGSNVLIFSPLLSRTKSKEEMNSLGSTSSFKP